MPVPKIDLTEEDGLVQVDLPQGHSVLLDLYSVNDRLIEIATASKERPAQEYFDALGDYFTTLGLPSMSVKKRMDLAKGILDATKALGNGHGRAGDVLTPGSPASTELLS